MASVAEVLPASFELDPKGRGYRLVYRENQTNQCPSCGRAQWYVGRFSAECSFCGTALALAEASPRGPAPQWKVPRGSNSWAQDWVELRKERRLPARGRVVKLLTSERGKEKSFTLANLSGGGLSGHADAALKPGQSVFIELESGIRIPAEVRWTENGRVGVGFTHPVPLVLLNPRG